MGYRSDVMAAFYVKDAKHLPMLKLWLTENFPLDMFADEIRWFDRGMLVEASNVKWYDDFDDVKAFNAAADKYGGLIYMDATGGDDPPKFSYEFVRIGESYDDVDTQYEGDACEWILGVNRSISVEV